MQKAGWALRMADCGVTPQAQKTGIAIVGLGQIGDADESRVTNVHGCAVHVGKPRGDLHRPNHICCRHGAHGHHHGATEGARRLGLHIGAEHGDVLAFLDVAQADACLDQCGLERERATENEGDQVRAPEAGDVHHLFGHFSVTPDAVERHIAANVDTLAE